jgi:hypothetical protein
MLAGTGAKTGFFSPIFPIQEFALAKGRIL